ncbi:MAG: type II toxin-antitoxin system VapC family toxin [Myxococcota bacterium]
MKFLLDTRAWLCWQIDPDRLSPVSRSSIENASSEIFLSVASTWEMTVKVASGKLRVPEPLKTMVALSLAQDGFKELRIENTHCFVLDELPVHHRDPFDRILVAQAISEGLTLISRDRRIAQYDVQVLTA